MAKNRICILIITIATITVSACDDLVKVDPPTNQLISATVFKDEKATIAAISGIYANLVRGGSFIDGGMNSIPFLASLSSDELIYRSTDNERIQFYSNSLQSANTIIEGVWRDCYNTIYNSNSLIEGLNRSRLIKDELRSQLIGESLFLRSLSHFYLVNTFGDVPFIHSTDYAENSRAARLPVNEVLNLIKQDLEEASSLLKDDYSFPQGERVRANKYAALALLAKVYLFLKEYENAEECATKIIDKSDLYALETDINRVFVANNREAILQFMPREGQSYTIEGQTFLGTTIHAIVSDDLYNSFEDGDARRASWIISRSIDDEDVYVPGKYKNTPEVQLNMEYSSILRLAEVYLIRAEARANLNKLIGENSSESDINQIRRRAGLADTTAQNKEYLIAAIIHERRHELMFEGANRWFDIKRLDKSTEVFGAEKAGWEPEDALYPIPNSEILITKNKQNDGY